MGRSLRIKSNSAEETREIGRVIGEQAQPGTLPADRPPGGGEKRAFRRVSAGGWGSRKTCAARRSC